MYVSLCAYCHKELISKWAVKKYHTLCSNKVGYEKAREKQNKKSHTVKRDKGI